ncbi:MAG TPA: ABC transporter permease [Candidatus Dormibacteraeota bacterium]
MRRVLLGRLGGALLVLLSLVTIVFLLRMAVRADPVKVRLGANASQQAVERERHRLGLDRPITVQFVTYLGGAIHGDLGESLHTRRAVRDDIADFLPATLELAAVAAALAVSGGMLLGVVGATARRGAGLLRLLFVAGASAPTFLIGLLLIYAFYQRLGWLPATGRTSLHDAPAGPTGLLLVDSLLRGRVDALLDGAAHLVLPAVCLALAPAAAVGRVLRSSLLDTYGADFVRTARAKGLHPWRILWRHALRASLSAPLTMIGLQTGLLLAGVVVVETVFAWPGIGLYTVQSIQAADFASVAGVTLLLGTVYVLVNLAVDLGQTAADPRLRAA